MQYRIAKAEGAFANSSTETLDEAARVLGFGKVLFGGVEVLEGKGNARAIKQDDKTPIRFAFEDYTVELTVQWPTVCFGLQELFWRRYTAKLSWWFERTRLGQDCMQYTLDIGAHGTNASNEFATLHYDLRTKTFVIGRLYDFGEDPIRFTKVTA
jgi:hypothetical protein